MSSFVRQAFYVAPPVQGAPVSMWQAWLDADKKAAIKAKREHTRSLTATELPTILTTISKRGGVYRQTSLVGFVGDSESLSPDVAVEANQERELAVSRMQIEEVPRGTVSKGRNARRRANKRANRAMRFR